MEWQLFYDLYASNFRKLTEKDGLPEWKRFSDTIKNPEVFREAIKPLAESYALGRNSGLGCKAPTLYQIRQAFTAACEKVRLNYHHAASSASCTLCAGKGKLVVFAPLAGDTNRENWPPDPTEMSFEDVRGIEVVCCPECVDKKCPEFLRAKIARNSVREWDRDRLYARLKNAPAWAKIIQ